MSDQNYREGQDEGEGEHKAATYSVHVESGVQIDIAKSLKDQHLSERAQDRADSSKQLFWTKIAAALIFIYTACSAWQVKIARDSFNAANRPWIAFDLTKENGNGVGIDYPFTPTSDGARASIGLHYWLVNSGHYPANVRINGEILDETTQQVQSLTFEPNEAQRLCDEGRQNFSKKPRRWSVVPGNPMNYGFLYNGDLSQENRLPTIDLRIADPSNNQPHDLTNLGCILYQSSSPGDNKIHQTPFLVKVKIRVEGPSVSETKGLLIIGKAD